MNSNPNHKPNATFNTPAQASRRKIAREVAAMYDDIARAAGFEPGARRAAFAVSIRLYERSNQPADTGRELSLAAIGLALTSKSDDKAAQEAAARRYLGNLFIHAIPRAGYQILTRFKAEEDSGEAHKYVDHLMQIAGFFSELLAEETARILNDKTLDRKGKGLKIAEARERLALDALEYLPKCEVELLTPEGVTYAYVSQADAKAFCAQKPEYTPRPYTYTPPAADGPIKKPFFSQDFDRIEGKIRAEIENYLDEISERNSFDDARLRATRLKETVQKALNSWVKVTGSTERGEENKELIYISDLSGGGGSEPGKSGDGPAQVPPDKLSPPPCDNSASDNELQGAFFETSENHPEETRNFDSGLEAAEFYARDGWHVLPVCNFNPDASRCTAEWHEETCKGRIPLVKGDGTPGYPQASKDLAKIRLWYTKYPDAGVALRMDGHILIDADAKDGGPESYRILADTFDLPETLSAITQSGDGRHYVFKLPEGLPDAWLKSWVRVGDKVELPGLDIKVDKCGLQFVEPTRGPKGVYRWIDPTFTPAEAPHGVCNFLHDARYMGEEEGTKKPKAKAARAATTATYGPRPFDPEQEKFFRDVAPNEGQHKRVLEVGNAAAGAGATRAQIEDVMRYHAGRFSVPLNDEAWMSRTVESVARRFGR